MKNINKLKPKTFVFDHELAERLSKPLQGIIKSFNEEYRYCSEDYPHGVVVKTEDWFLYLEKYIADYITLTDKAEKEIEVLRKYLIHNAEFDYIFISDAMDDIIIGD
jgi:hypothetical protein